jgi:hypothetical protein
MPFPAPPWRLRARAWLSVFAVRDTGRPDRPPGAYAAAFVAYRPGGVLTYHELLVARLVRDGRSARVRVSDIWVDSAESLAGGRALWALPKQPADLPLDEPARGGSAPGSRASFSGVAQGQHLASGTFTTLPAPAVLRVPFAFTVSQLREDGSPVVAPAGGSARPLPSRGSWRFDAEGPLGFLHGRRPLLSVELRDVRLRFG